MKLVAFLLAILFVGDSLTAANPGFAVNGERAVTYHIADSILFLEEAGHYDRIVLELGIHAVRGSDRLYALNPDLFRRRYGQLLDVAQDHAQEVVAVNIPWLDWNATHADRARLFNAIIQGEAEARGIYVVDAWSIMEQCGLACIGEDGFHPNQEGYDRIRRALPWMQRLYLPLVIAR